MTEYATKEELQAVIDDLNDRLRKQHVINKTVAMIVNELLVTSAASSMVIKTIAPMVSAPEGMESELEDRVNVAKTFLSSGTKRQEELCLILLQAVSGDQQGIEEKLREAFSRKP
ncbi:hypothetical protein [Pseudomonas helleri]|uniref:hypothetical protein n=1 Tax=Pseudomonas helleri TaxID=1608996 RepID=UPI003FD07C36